MPVGDYVMQSHVASSKSAGVVKGGRGGGEGVCAHERQVGGVTGGGWELRW